MGTRCLGDIKRVPWIGLGEQVEGPSYGIGSGAEGIRSAMGAPSLCCRDTSGGVGRVAPLSYSTKH